MKVNSQRRMTCRPIKQCAGLSSSDKSFQLTVKALVFNNEKDDTMVIKSARAKTMAIVLILAVVIYFRFKGRMVFVSGFRRLEMLGVEQQTANAQSITSTVLSSTKQYACSEKEKLESHTIIVGKKGSNNHYDPRPKARICMNPPCCSAVTYYVHLYMFRSTQHLQSQWSTAGATQHSQDMTRFVTA